MTTKTCGECRFYLATSPRFGSCEAASDYPHTSREVGRDFWAGLCRYYSRETNATEDTPASQDASKAAQ